MLYEPFKTLTISIITITLGSLARTDPVCSRFYGRPLYSDCSDLTEALANGWPGDNPERRDHLFSLRFARIPPGTSGPARKNRIYLPKFAQQGRIKRIALPWITQRRWLFSGSFKGVVWCRWWPSIKPTDSLRLMSLTITICCFPGVR